MPKKPLIALAPMADYTDRPFSLLCREVSGKDFVIFREMVNAVAITRGSVKTLRMCEFERKESPLVIQFFGDQPKIMAEAAEIIVRRFQPDGLDINMGCPVPKIAEKSRAGAGLLREPELAGNIVRAIKERDLGVPISVKTRLGWQDNREIFEFIKYLEDAGVDQLELHGRTKKQGYSGEADWQTIAEVIKMAQVPVVANGDIRELADIQECLKITKAHGVMIGRGALGNPWILSNQPIDLTLSELIKTVQRHAELHLAHYGEKSLVTFRKHLLWYFHGERAGLINEPKKIRTALVKVSSLSDLDAILTSLEKTR